MKLREQQLGGRTLYQDASTLRVLLGGLSLPAHACSAVMNRIWLVYGNGSAATDYDVTQAGFTAAEAASSSGDVIYVLAAVTIADNHTIDSGVTVFGLGENTVFSGTITNNGILNNLKLSAAPAAGSVGKFMSVIILTGGIANGVDCIIENSDGSTTNYNVIGGGLTNTIDTGGSHGPNTTDYNTIAGGSYGYIQSGQYNAIGGGYGAGIYSNYGFVGGGYDNNIFDEHDYSAICGGRQNQISVDASSIGSQGYNFIGGGYGNNLEDCIYSVIAGGWANLIDGEGSEANSNFIGGGDSNEITDDADYSCIEGGYYNAITDADYATIAGGSYNDILTGGHYSFAAGRKAQISHAGTFMFADSTNANFASATANEFAVRAGGGSRFIQSGGEFLIDQASDTGAKPVLKLDQADIDVEFIHLVGSSEDSTADRSLVDVADMTTPGALVGWFQIYVEDIQGTNPITDGVYYVPFYAAPSA